MIDYKFIKIPIIISKISTEQSSINETISVLIISVIPSQ